MSTATLTARINANRAKRRAAERRQAMLADLVTYSAIGFLALAGFAFAGAMALGFGHSFAI